MSTITKANKANIPPQQTTITVSVDSNGNVVTNSIGDPVQNVILTADADYSGTIKTYRMVAVSDADTPSGASQIFDDATGVLAFEVALSDEADNALVAGEDVVIAYSTIASDANALANAANCCAENDGAAGARTGAAYYNVIILNAERTSAVIKYDGTNKIKRIVGVNSQATTNPVAYDLITVS